MEFFDFYHETCAMLSKVTNTENKALILGGEGILGLEAACASLTEPGDRVLVIDNGIFGKGFADFVKIYGGQPVLYTADYHKKFYIMIPFSIQRHFSAQKRLPQGASFYTGYRCRLILSPAKLPADHRRFPRSRLWFQL